MHHTYVFRPFFLNSMYIRFIASIEVKYKE